MGEESSLTRPLVAAGVLIDLIANMDLQAARQLENDTATPSLLESTLFSVVAKLEQYRPWLGWT